MSEKKYRTIRDEYVSHVRKFSESAATEEAVDEAFFAEKNDLTKPIPSRPTRTIPGSLYRLEVYTKRIARGEAIFHPEDRDFTGVRNDNFTRAMYSGSANKSGTMVGPRRRR